jgi:hypothetical protein
MCQNIIPGSIEFAHLGFFIPVTFGQDKGVILRLIVQNFPGIANIQPFGNDQPNGRLESCQYGQRRRLIELFFSSEKNCSFERKPRGVIQ